MEKLKQGVNDLKTWCLLHREYGEQLLKEWNIVKNRQLGFTPDTISRAGNQKSVVEMSKMCVCQVESA